MATNTTNYNLSKPEASDPFGDFRQSYNDNLDIIDANLGGGGGSGGHTILDGDGNTLPQEDDLQFTGACSVTDDNVNGRTVVDVVACIKVTQAEYDALPASKLTDNIAYFIVDGESDEYKAKADKTDLASIQITGSTNNTGATITSGTYFYLNDTLVRAKTAIANGATLTLNTNYEVVTAGVLNDFKWSLIATVANNVDVDIPLNAQEVIVEISYSSVSYSVHFATIAPSNSYREGYYTSATNNSSATVVWNSSTRKVYGTALSFAGAVYNSTVRVYIR